MTPVARPRKTPEPINNSISMKRPGTSDSETMDDPVSRLAFPVLTFCNNGCLNLKFRARRKDLERTTTFEVKV